jgi:hypothetical protein
MYSMLGMIINFNIYSENESDGMLLINASNAFNSLSRYVTLHNIGVIFPSFHQILEKLVLN